MLPDLLDFRMRQYGFTPTGHLVPRNDGEMVWFFMWFVSFAGFADQVTCYFRLSPRDLW